MKRFWAEAYGALQHVLFMYNDWSELMSADCISILTTIKHFCRESWKNILSKLK